MSFFNGEKDNESRFHVYGIGVAVKDKVKFSDELEIYLVEQFPYVEGKLTEAKVEHKSELPDSKGTTKSHEVKGGYTITAKWLPDGANNQITAPDVYKGESVKILRFADSSKYFWSTMMREPKLRKQETVATMYSNIKDPTKEGYDKESSYWTQVDTREKKWQLHTSRNDGEPCIYDIVIDTKEAKITIEDDLGNKFILDSQASKWYMTNASGNTFTMAEGNTNLDTPEAVSMKSTSTSMESSDATQISSGSDMGINSGGGLNMSCDGESNMQAGGTFRITASDVVIEGNVTINGNLKVSGDIDVGGSLKSNSIIYQGTELASWCQNHI